MLTTIPVLPCISMTETLAFYEALGFEVTHRQTRPYVYLATHRGDVHLHFVGIPKLTPEAAYSTCLVLTDELEALHRTFCEALRALYGRLPLTGFPRISRLRPGQGRFTVVDVAGNSLVFIRRGAKSEEEPHEPPPGSRAAQALHVARRLRDFKNEDAEAARVLDAALRREDPDATPLERARLLAARIEIATVLGEQEREAELRAELDAMPLGDAERAELRSTLATQG